MSTPRTYQDACGGYHEYTRGVQYTRGIPMSTPGDFGTNDKKPRPNFENFVLAPLKFCNYAVIYFSFCNIR